MEYKDGQQNSTSFHHPEMKSTHPICSHSQQINYEKPNLIVNKPQKLWEKCVCLVFWLLSLVPSYRAEVGFMTYTGASHQVAIKTLWLHLQGAVTLSIFIQSMGTICQCLSFRSWGLDFVSHWQKQKVAAPSCFYMKLSQAAAGRIFVLKGHTQELC